MKYQPKRKRSKRNLVGAVILSVLFPGAGHLYAGRYIQAAVPLLFVLGCGLAYRVAPEAALSAGGLVVVLTTLDVGVAVQRENRLVDDEHRKARARTMKRCSSCAEQIQAAAIVCRFCQREQRA